MSETANHNPYPLRQLFWESTLRCNMHCRHCGSDCAADSVTPDMPLEHFLPVLDEIRERQPGVKVLVSTLGGEPLVRPDILECGREITRRGFHWGMVSNAMLIDGPMMRNLSEAGLRSLAIDVDGLPADHDWLRRQPGAFDRVYEAIGHVREAPGLTWDVITCVHRRNLPSLPEMARMLEEAGVREWRLFTIVPMGRAANAGLQLSDEEFRRLLDFIVETRRRGGIRPSYSCEGFLGLYEKKVRDYQYHCQAGTTVASVLADGGISGCLSVRSDYRQGNIYRDSFWDVWTNRFKPFRDRSWMRVGQCGECEVWDYCHGNGFHLRRDDGSLMTCHYRRLYYSEEDQQP